MNIFRVNLYRGKPLVLCMPRNTFSRALTFDKSVFIVLFLLWFFLCLFYIGVAIEKLDLNLTFLLFLSKFF
jgi:hypothetical protein